MHQPFEYLHDCALLEIKYDITDSENRKLTLLVEVPKDHGYPAWAGQTLCITVHGIYFLQYIGWGHVMGQEFVDRWSEGISDPTEMQLQKHEAMGLNVPNTKFTVTFHSGSYFEVVSENVSVNIKVEKEAE